MINKTKAQCKNCKYGCSGVNTSPCRCECHKPHLSKSVEKEEIVELLKIYDCKNPEEVADDILELFKLYSAEELQREREKEKKKFGRFMSGVVYPTFANYMKKYIPQRIYKKIDQELKNI